MSFVKSVAVKRSFSVHSHDIQEIIGNNTSYIEEMFQNYSSNPESVSGEWRAYFEGFHSGFDTASKLAQNPENYLNLLSQLSAQKRDSASQAVSAPVLEQASKSLGAPSSEIAFELKCAQFVKAWMQFGHLFAETSPVEATMKPYRADIDLSPGAFGLNESDMNKVTQSSVTLGIPPLPLSELITRVKELLSGTVGVEFAHLEAKEEQKWLVDNLNRLHVKPEKQVQEALFTELAKADALEKTIATKYVGKKRFSIEGADALVPAIESFIESSYQFGTREFDIALAHRGRLNVLVHCANKPIEMLLSEWEGMPHKGIQGDFDVKYHAGYETERPDRQGRSIRVSIPFNPSHLEYVNSVVQGVSRARQDFYHNQNKNAVSTIIVHGDAAIAGQGIVYEVVQMMSLEGYSVGGTLHIIANNQVGFSTNPSEARSSTYCTGVAKVTASPVFHVNAEDIEAVHNVMVLAAEYRGRFQKDVYVDLICYRRYGHNEADEPMFTQPILYKEIKNKIIPYEIYLQNLVKEGFVEEDLRNIYSSYKERLTEAFDRVKEEKRPINQFRQPREFEKITQASEKDMLTDKTKTSLNLEELKAVAAKIVSVPSTFHFNPKIGKNYEERAEMAKGSKPVDWGFGELLAYASLLGQGYSVRLTGEDVGRGTFSHRHVLLTDYETGSQYNVLTSAVDKEALVSVYNSHLSEEGTMGYEYGYATMHPKALVLWEAQYGDFGNGAQVIIDQFIASAESKWLQTQGLVLLLPHGYEGAGPEHSSARLERFLSLCAEGNMQVCYLTNSSQLFHALRRQVLRPFRKPLVIMTPKSFLRNQKAAVKIEELASSHFHEILDDKRPFDKLKIDRVVLCTGKIAIELEDVLEATQNTSVAIVRLEQIYPLHKEALKSILAQYSNAKTFVWLQEEPKNMGAWPFISSELSLMNLIYVGRSKRATTAVGLEKRHKVEQEKILEEVLKTKILFEV